ncbi:MAG: hypothetical protein QM762_25040 [Chryseolinea sp.]
MEGREYVSASSQTDIEKDIEYRCRLWASVNAADKDGVLRTFAADNLHARKQPLIKVSPSEQALPARIYQ